jgi:O-antigen/teichoic acid export membrane protein
MGERVHRSMMNIKVGMFFYVLSLFLAFFSRKIFLDCLGAEFIGLTGMLTNIMSFLSVAELGIGTSIVYFLYKPLQEDNHERINEIISMLSFLYRCIGYFIGASGIVISFLFPWWFDNLTTDLPLVFFAFYSFLASSVAGYIFNYKQLLVIADQKQYLVSAYFQSISIIESTVQIFLAYYYRNLWLWVVVGLIFTLIGIIVFNIRIRQLYPWLCIDLKKGRQHLKKYPEILKKTRQIFVQKIKDFILYRSDEIFVGMFVSVIKVAYFGNYTMILNKLNFFVNILSVGIGDGIGNLIAEGDEKKIMKIFWELTATRFLILGVIIFSLLIFFQSFIGCWLGHQYQLSNIVVYLLIFNFFLRLQNAAVYIYIGASGLFSDVWTAWTELIINLSIILLLAPTYGIIGILTGKILSFFFISVFWKPYFLFSQGFHKSVWIFWQGMVPYYTIFAIFTFFSLWIKHSIINQHSNSLLSLIICGFVSFIPLISIYFILLFRFTTGMKYFVARKPTIYHILNRITFNNVRL